MRYYPNQHSEGNMVPEEPSAKMMKSVHLGASPHSIAYLNAGVLNNFTRAPTHLTATATPIPSYNMINDQEMFKYYGKFMNRQSSTVHMWSQAYREVGIRKLMIQ